MKYRIIIMKGKNILRITWHNKNVNDIIKNDINEIKHFLVRPDFKEHLHWFLD